MTGYKFVLLFLLFFIQKTYAQLLINGTDFIITTNGIVYVNNDSLIVNNSATFIQNGYLEIDKDLITENGVIVNDGDIYINRNVIINDSIVGLNNTSQFYLSGNWTNNNVFIPGQSTVTLNGASQEIKGTEVTSFFNLIAFGNLSDKKELTNINAKVLSNLDIGNVEFATNENNLSVVNPNVNSIVRNTGFVSSLDTGKLERQTNTLAPYLFPTGSTDGTTIYRPIIFTPNNAGSNKFGARLANLDATIDSYNVLQLSDSLCAVNPKFYHRLYAESGSADITMHYLPTDDGMWDVIANWNSTDLWDKKPVNNNSTSTNFSTITSLNVNDYSEPAFALGIKKPSLNLEDQIDVISGESVLITPFYSGLTPNNIIWTPLENVSCPVCIETEITPTESIYYTLEIDISENCRIRDSILLSIKPGALMLPTAFSPNLDGVNDYLIPLNTNIDSYKMNVYNRWGELVYKTDDFRDGWDGIYKGNKAPIGVYSYSAEYKNIGFKEIQIQTGNITLIR